MRKFSKITLSQNVISMINDNISDTLLNESFFVPNLF